jgi:hypothetical protein
VDWIISFGLYFLLELILDLYFSYNLPTRPVSTGPSSAPPQVYWFLENEKFLTSESYNIVSLLYQKNIVSLFAEKIEKKEWVYCTNEWVVY